MSTRAIIHSSSARKHAPVTASIAYMRALAITASARCRCAGHDSPRGVDSEKLIVTPLLDGDLGAPHDRAPLRRFGLDHGSELRWRIRDGFGAQSGEFLPHVGLA